MCSTWWTNLDSLPNHAQDKQTNPPQATASFHSPKSSACDLALDTRLETDNIANSSNSMLTSGPSESSSLENEANECSSASLFTDRENKHCNVINIKIPLTFDKDVQLFQHCFSTSRDEHPPQHNENSAQGTESPMLSNSTRYKSISFGKGDKINDQHTGVTQPPLSSTKLVDFSSAGQPVCMQQSTKASYVPVPSLTESQFLGDTFQHPASAATSTWKDLRSRLSQCRPVFNHSHYSPFNESPPKLCSCSGDCARLLLSDARPIPPSSLALNGYRYPQGNLSSGRLSLVPGTTNRAELPPLEMDYGKGGKELTSLTHQMQGLSVLKYQPIQSISTQRRARMVPQSSALKNRSRKAVAKYPDPLIGGMSSYQKRLCQLSILVSETVKHEKEKASQKAKKATGNGGGIKE